MRVLAKQRFKLGILGKASPPVTTPRAPSKIAPPGDAPAPTPKGAADVDRKYDRRLDTLPAGFFSTWPVGEPTVQPAGRGGSLDAWLAVAGQILAGEFEGADRGMKASLVIGLRGIDHPVARAALNRIQPRAAD